ncbi:Mu transposase C-terminal domain-containing protein [Paracoccus sp. JM45]|uniref:Mu transposase C-terminal domain-containing protein n=1 Tax=Paracoccus sp. JM45 TaxID=2283626 RepID=UPI001C71AEC0|nr:Mu transposase C-terminal domain-containing protein [Paracoccus sp. JM45]
MERIEDPNISRSYTHSEIIDLLAAPDVAFLRGEFTASSAARRLRGDTRYLSSLPAKHSERLLWQAAWVELFLFAERQGEVKRTERSVIKSLPSMTNRINDEDYRRQYFGKQRRVGFELKSRQAPCPKSLLSWVRQYERYGGTPLALMRKQRSPSSYYIHFQQEEKELLTECVANYLDLRRPTKTKIASDTRQIFTECNIERVLHGKRPLKIPSIRTVERRIGQLDPFEITVQRHGIEYAKHKFSFYENGILAEHPMQRIEMDDWEIDLMSLLGESGALDRFSSEERARLDVGRRWLCLAIDCATRCIVAFRLTEKPETENALAVLHLITQDKTPISQAANCSSPWNQYGGIGTVVTDQGVTLTAKLIRMAVSDLGGTYEAPAAGQPKLRARVERIFRTLGQQLAPMLTGRTFGNPRERGDYPSEKLAALTDDDLAQIITLFIVDIYHKSPHAGLGGETPENAWKRLASEQGVTLPPDANNRRAVFGLELERKLSRHGVRVFGINYTSTKLQEMLLHSRQRDVKIRVDPLSLTYISVWIGNKWYTAEAVNQAVWALSLEEWQSIVRNLRTSFKDQAQLSVQDIWDARQKIKTIDTRAQALRRIMPNQLSTADLERAERHLFMGISIGPEGTCASGAPAVGTGDLLNDVIHSQVSISPTDHCNDNDTRIDPSTDPSPSWRVSRD